MTPRQAANKLRSLCHRRAQIDAAIHALEQLQNLRAARLGEVPAFSARTTVAEYLESHRAVEPNWAKRIDRRSPAA